MNPPPQLPVRVLPRPEVLRRNVAEKLEHLPHAELAVLHDMMQEMELRAAWREFSEGMAGDWAAGKYEHLEAAIAQAGAASMSAQAASSAAT